MARIRLTPGAGVAFSGFEEKSGRGRTRHAYAHWRDYVKTRGLTPTVSVTRDTCSLLVAKDPAEQEGKVQTARRLNIPVISEAAFIDLIGEPGAPNENFYLSYDEGERTAPQEVAESKYFGLKQRPAQPAERQSAYVGLAGRLPWQESNAAAPEQVPVVREALEPYSLFSEADVASEPLLTPVTAEEAVEVSVAAPRAKTDDPTKIALMKWASQLIDTSARNPLVNSASVKSAVPLRGATPEALYQHLRDSSSKPWTVLPGTDADGRVQPDVAPAAKVFAGRLPDAELRRISRAIMRTSNAAYIDKAIWRTYLALGSLAWQNDKGKDMLSPLVLLPVELRILGKQGAVQIQPFANEEPRFNHAVTEVVKRLREVDLELGEIMDEDNLLQRADLSEVLDRVETKVRSVNQRYSLDFKVGRDLARVLNFNFAAESVYFDLVKNLDSIALNDHVRAFAHVDDAQRTEQAFSAPLATQSIYPRVGQKGVPPLLFNIDDSQAQAVSACLSNPQRNFVIQGPPGTGKSQTISNLIAAYLYEGKSVLFVSDKAAAVEVVEKRLNSRGLGNKVLNLHAPRTRAKYAGEVMIKADNFGYAEASEKAMDREIAELQEIIRKQRAYSDQIRSQKPLLGLSISDLIGELSRLNTDASDMPKQISYVSASHLAADQRYNLDRLLRELAQSWNQIHSPTNPWQHVNSPESPELQHVLNAYVAALSASKSSLDAAKLPAHARIESFEDYQTAIALLQTARQVPAGLPEQFFDHEVLAQATSILRELVLAIESLVQARQSLTELASKSQVNPDSLSLPTRNELSALLLNLRLSFDTTVQEVTVSTSEVQQLKETAGRLETLLAYARVPLSVAQQLSAANLTDLDSFFRELSVLTADKDLRPAAAVASRAEVLTQVHILDQLEAEWAQMKQLGQKLTGLYDMERLLEELPEVTDALGSLKETKGRAPMLAPKGVKQARKVLESLLTNAKQADKIAEQYSALNAYVQHANVVTSLLAQEVSVFRIVKLTPDTDWSETRAMIESQLRLFAAQNLLPSELQEVTASWLHYYDPAPSPELVASTLSYASGIQHAAYGLSNSNLHEGVQHLDKLAQAWAGLTRLFKTNRDLPDFLTLRELLELASAKDVVGAQTANYNALGDAWRALDVHVSFTMTEDISEAKSQVLALLNMVRWVEEFSRLGRHLDADLALRPRMLVADEVTCEVLNDHCQKYEAARQAAAEFMEGSWKSDLLSDQQAIEKLRARLQSLLDDREGRTTWIAFQRHRKELAELGLASIAEQAKKHEFENATRIEAFFYKILYQPVVEQSLNNLAQQLDFSGTGLDELGKNHVLLDEKIRAREPQRLLAKLDDHAEAARQAQVQVHAEESNFIGQQGRAKRGHFTIRTQIKRAQNELLWCMPVFMMSPKTVSDFLPSEMKFDVVIYDEASQLTVPYAINSVVKGRQLVIVGDDLQMPASSYFARSDDEEEVVDEEQQTATYESILNAAASVASFNKECALKVHYRSNHESLINFSSERFYRAKRNINLEIPAAARGADRSLGIQWLSSPPNSYTAGTNGGYNQPEAELVAKRILHYAREYPDKSIGVITISVKQQAQVQSEIDKLIERSSEAAAIFNRLSTSEDILNRFFLKNLENVQGDERDIIILSLGYGKQADGKFIQSFGPLSSENGWRRLNVAITRSKDILEVVSSLHGSDLSESDNENRQALSEFLDYAEHGGKSATFSTSSRRGAREGSDSPFEEEVKLYIESIGYRLRQQVGVDTFSIDMGVYKGESLNFGLGIECDGATYHSSEEARSRDIVRQEILEARGWNIYRIWSTHWFQNRSEEEQKLKAALEYYCK